MSFKNLKTTSGNIDRLVKEISKMNSPNGDRSEDDKFWKPELDKSGNGMAIIRFLPAAEADGDDATPWVRLWTHWFEGPTGKKYIENSLTTLNQKDPVTEFNSILWNSTKDENSKERKQARDQKRKLTYISNIYVISDPKRPENEGKVFLFRYGKKIFDKIDEAIRPPFDEQGRTPDNPKYNPTNAFVPFDLWKGANFKLRIRKVDGYQNYDQSTFDAPSPLKKSDDELEAIWKSQYPLNTFTAPSNFKSYDELKAKFEDVMGISKTPYSALIQKSEEMKSNRATVLSNDDDVDLSEAEKEFSVDDEELDQFKKLVNA